MNNFIKDIDCSKANKIIASSATKISLGATPSNKSDEYVSRISKISLVLTDIQKLIIEAKMYISKNNRKKVSLIRDEMKQKYQELRALENCNG